MLDLETFLFVCGMAVFVGLTVLVLWKVWE